MNRLDHQFQFSGQPIEYTGICIREQHLHELATQPDSLESMPILGHLRDNVLMDSKNHALNYIQYIGPTHPLVQKERKKDILTRDCRAGVTVPGFHHAENLEKHQKAISYSDCSHDKDWYQISKIDKSGKQPPQSSVAFF